jgi:hypothetical protein
MLFFDMSIIIISCGQLSIAKLALNPPVLMNIQNVHLQVHFRVESGNFAVRTNESFGSLMEAFDVLFQAVRSDVAFSTGLIGFWINEIADQLSTFIVESLVDSEARLGFENFWTKWTLER